MKQIAKLPLFIHESNTNFSNSPLTSDYTRLELITPIQVY